MPPAVDRLQTTSHERITDVIGALGPTVLFTQQTERGRKRGHVKPRTAHTNIRTYTHALALGHRTEFITSREAVSARLRQKLQGTVPQLHTQRHRLASNARVKERSNVV